jgi:hypothetical protein
MFLWSSEAGGRSTFKKIDNFTLNYYILKLIFWSYYRLDFHLYFAMTISQTQPRLAEHPPGQFFNTTSRVHEALSAVEVVGRARTCQENHFP